MSTAAQTEQLRIAVTGASGLVGSALLPRLQSAGHTVQQVSRSAAAGNIVWNPANGQMPAEPLEGVNAVVHLAGENIAAARWSASSKQRILESRRQGTQLLCETLAGLQKRPQVLVSASATGFYGDRGDEVCTEASPPGEGFLPEVCQAWENATQAAQDAGIRVVHLRIGVVLSREGGALKKMLLPFLMGAGGKVGSGRQYWSWITLDDLVGAIEHCLTHDSLKGPVNAVSPNPATNLEFTKALGRVLRRPTILPMPAFMIRLALGEMADALLLASARVAPIRLIESEFDFQYPELDQALRHVLKSS